MSGKRKGAKVRHARGLYPEPSYYMKLTREEREFLDLCARKSGKNMKRTILAALAYTYGME